MCRGVQSPVGIDLQPLDPDFNTREEHVMFDRIRFSHAVTIAAVSVALAACQSSYTRGGSPAGLTDRDGRTTYIFDKDRPDSGVSACYGPCAAQWPPVIAGALGDRESAAVGREDGIRQATYRGRPLYYFAGDSKPGDRSGDGIGGVWHIAGEQREGVQTARGAGRYVGGY